jgi:lactate dehydrogenase-like 2-hydroxyacid dehydrogenase
MKKNSVIINVSRAGLIDNKYLYYILKKKKIHGGGFDVYEKEPTSKYDNFMKLKNIVATPHVAGSTLDTYREVLSNCLLNIKNAIYDNKKVKWRINEIL